MRFSRSLVEFGPLSPSVSSWCALPSVAEFACLQFLLNCVGVQLTNQRSAQVVWVFRTVGSPIVTVFVFDEPILGSTRNPLATGCNVNMKEVTATFNTTPRIPENIFHPRQRCFEHGRLLEQFPHIEDWCFHVRDSDFCRTGLGPVCAHRRVPFLGRFQRKSHRCEFNRAIALMCSIDNQYFLIALRVKKCQRKYADFILFLFHCTRRTDKLDCLSCLHRSRQWCASLITCSFVHMCLQPKQPQLEK